MLDTETRALTSVRNPVTSFEKIIYDDTNKDYNEFDTTYLKNKFVKIVVKNKTDLFTFDRFVDRIQNLNIHDLKIQENFQEFMGENVEDTEVSIEDTSVLLNAYIDNVDTDLEKDVIKMKMHELMKEAQALEIQ